MIQCYHVRCFACICSECKTLQEELVEAIERGTLNANRVYHLRYERSLDLDFPDGDKPRRCPCEDCQPFDHTDPGHDGVSLLAALQTQVEFYQRALSIILWLRWVLDEDERRALREFRLEYLLFFEAGVRASEERFVDAHRELQRRGF